MLAVVILTFNESLHIARAIESVKDLATEIFVVDSFSTDGTQEIARSLGVYVVEHRFINQAEQFNWALRTLSINAAWTMRLDADEVIGLDLKFRLRRSLPRLSADVHGVLLLRQHIWMGKPIRFGGRRFTPMLRIWRTGSAVCEQRWMDEHMMLLAGRATSIKGYFADHNLNNLSYFTDKHNKYATREAIQRILVEHGVMLAPMNRRGQSFKTRLIYWTKHRIYERLPYLLASTFYLFWRLVLRLGILDGRTGICYHVLQGFWYRTLVGAKHEELLGLITSTPGSDSIPKQLSKLTGLPVDAWVHPQ